MNQEILATIAGTPVTQEDFEVFAASLPQEAKSYLQNPDAVAYFKEQLIAVCLFAQYGKDEKLTETEEYQKLIANAQRDILGQMVMRDLLSNIQVSDEEAKAYYDAHQSEFQENASVNAKHILMESEEELKGVRSRIASGELTFEDAAKEYSTCPSKERGGDLGQFGRGQMVKEFEDVAFTAEIGKVSDPVKTQFGYHLIKVEAKSDAKAQSFEQVKDNVKRTLSMQKQEEIYHAKVKELKEKYC